MISVVIISKDEPDLDYTLADVASQVAMLAEPAEIVVVDASNYRLDHIKSRHAGKAGWLDFEPPPGVHVSIPHQRNVGVRAALGDIIVFTDAGARPSPDWLARLVAPLRQGESVTAGVCTDLRGKGRYEVHGHDHAEVVYVKENPTINFAFRREVFDELDGFDETFEYGSDTDFCWRLVDAGFRIRRVAEAVVQSDWGSVRRQRRRAYVYGKARTRLYRKHAERRRHVVRDDPVVIIYPLFLLCLPLTLIFPVYPFLLLVPAWRNRGRRPFQAISDHLWFGAGVLYALARR